MFGNMNIPVPAQNSCLREFVGNKNGNYVLPFLESSFENCFHQLFGLVNTIEKNSNIVMYSVTMLPSGKKLDEFLELCIKKNVVLFFVLENFDSKIPYSNLLTEIEVYNLKRLEAKVDYEKI